MPSSDDTSESSVQPRAQWRVFGLAGLVFLILGSYAIARPSTESLFMESHGAASLPRVWVLVALGSLVVVTLYNRWSRHTDLVVLFGVVSAISATLLVLLLGAQRAHLPGWAYALYIWKDLYIVVLIEIFWSFANSVFRVDRARWVYGMFLVLGGLGGMTGNLLGGELAQKLGSENVLWGVLPLLLLATLGCWVLDRGRKPSPQKPASNKSRPSLTEGFKVLKNSRALWLLMGLILASQVVITTIDYQTNLALEAHFPDTDQRTRMIGRIYAAIDAVSIGLQLGTGPILRLVGVPAVLVAIPALLGACMVGFIAAPRFAMIGICKVCSKAFDYSLFRAAKEILYIPLSHAEKTQGKALVDMMTYRVAKGATSLLLLGLIGLSQPSLVGWLTIVVVVFWIWITTRLVRNWKARSTT